MDDKGWKEAVKWAQGKVKIHTNCQCGLCNAACAILAMDAELKAREWRPGLEVPIDALDLPTIIGIVEYKIGLTNVRIASHDGMPGHQSVFRKLNAEYDALLRRLKALMYHSVPEPPAAVKGGAM